MFAGNHKQMVSNSSLNYHLKTRILGETGMKHEMNLHVHDGRDLNNSEQSAHYTTKKKVMFSQTEKHDDIR